MSSKRNKNVSFLFDDDGVQKIMNENSFPAQRKPYAVDKQNINNRKQQTSAKFELDWTSVFELSELLK